MANFQCYTSISITNVEHQTGLRTSVEQVTSAWLVAEGKADLCVSSENALVDEMATDEDPRVSP